MHVRKVKRALILFGCGILLTGCLKMDTSLEEIDPPEDAKTVKSKEAMNNQEQEKIAQKLYLIDANGMVAPQTLEVPFPKSKEVAKQALEYLVKEGPVTPILPNGFRPVLPEGTDILGLTLQEDGTVIVDLSEEFKQYHARDEQKILESVTHTLTQFNTIDVVKLRVNGEELEEMPVNGTPIKRGYSKENGINIIEASAHDLLMSEPVIFHLPAEFNGSRYYVPITKYIQPNKEEAIYETVVHSLLNEPIYKSNVIHVFNENVNLVKKPKIKNGILELHFNQNILKDQEKGIIADDVTETLTRSLTEFQEVNGIDIQVENQDELVNEKGEKMKTPVMAESMENEEVM